MISPSVANGQTATCWIDQNNRYAFTANTVSGTISVYKIETRNGRLALLNAEAGSGNLPIDLGTTICGRFLYVLNAGDGTIGMFRIKSNGTLIDLGSIDAGLSIFAQGIAVR